MVIADAVVIIRAAAKRVPCKSGRRPNFVYKLRTQQSRRGEDSIPWKFRCALGFRGCGDLRTRSRRRDQPVANSVPDTQPILRNIPSSSAAASCEVRFPLLRTCARQTDGRMSSQPPRFQWLGQNQASSNPRQVSGVPKQRAPGFGVTTGSSIRANVRPLSILIVRDNLRRVVDCGCPRVPDR